VVSAAAVKATAGLALPFMWLASRRRIAFAGGAGAAGLAVVAVAAVAFGSHLLEALTSFSDQGGYTSLRSFPGQLSQGFLGMHDVSHTVEAVAQVTFVAVVLVLAAGVWRGAGWVTALGWATLALLLAQAWLMPWYVAWLLPFAALGDSRRLRLAALLFTAFALVVRVPYPPF